MCQFMFGRHAMAILAVAWMHSTRTIAQMGAGVNKKSRDDVTIVTRDGVNSGGQSR
jgi:hypothetical protein